tara:strand:+ start:32573 stop:32839 length:267 start_codon:yes stop_codon:yes gene_type:complete
MKLAPKTTLFIATLKMPRFRFMAVHLTAQEAVDTVLDQFEQWADMSQTLEVGQDYMSYWVQKDRDEWEEEVEWISLELGDGCLDPFVD